MKNPTQYLWKGLCALLLIGCGVLAWQWNATANHADRTEDKLAKTEKTADSLRIVIATKPAQTVTVEVNTGKQGKRNNCPCK